MKVWLYVQPQGPWPAVATHEWDRARLEALGFQLVDQIEDHEVEGRLRQMDEERDARLRARPGGSA
jgi:hypothetical protein